MLAAKYAVSKECKIIGASPCLPKRAVIVACLIGMHVQLHTKHAVEFAELGWGPYRNGIVKSAWKVVL